MARRVSAQQLSSWYRQLAQSSAAGSGMAEAVRRSTGPPTADREDMAARLERGEAVDAVLETAPEWLPMADRYLLSAATQSGRLPEICAALADQHQSAAGQQRQLLAACAYPLVILHLALVAFPLPLALSFNPSTGPQFNGRIYFGLLLLVLVLFWGTLRALRALFRNSPATAARIHRRVPGLRRYARCRRLARFAWGLGTLLGAGVTMRDAFGGAAIICDDSRLTPRLLAVLPLIDCGQPPGAALEQVNGIPEDFTALYQTGERTGQLAATLNRLHQHYENEAQAALRSAVFWYPKLLFIPVALLIAVAVAQAFTRYLQFVESLAH